MIDQLTAVRTVCTDSSLLSKIFNYVRHDYLRQCREVNKRWRFLADKILRPKTRVCVNELNVKVMLVSNTILGLSLHIRWSPVAVTVPLTEVIRKYCRYIGSLSWFMQDSGMPMVNQERHNQIALEHRDLASLSFPCLKEIRFLISCPKTEYYYALMLIDRILEKCPELESIRIEIAHENITITKLIKCIVDKRLTKLVSIHFGESVQLFPADFHLLASMKPSLKTLSWIGNAHGIEPIPTDGGAYDEAFPVKFFKHLDTLKIDGLRRHVIPAKQFPLRCLSISNLNLVTTIPLSSQFPLLEELSFSFDSDYFDWERWIPQDMAPHPSIKSLKWLNKESFNGSSMKCFLRLCDKLPNLEKVCCPVNDKFLEQIISRLPRLKKLELSGNCTDYGITGISEMYCSVIHNLFESGHLKKTQSVLKPYRQIPSLCDLHYLEELTLLHTQIADDAVLLAISVINSLKKVYITGISMTAIVELLQLPNIQEIGVPQPFGNTVEFGDIVYLKETNPHIRIIAGWDSDDFLRTRKNGCNY